MLARTLFSALAAQPGPRLLPFQREFVAGSFADGIDEGALSAPRGAGKTMLLGRIAALAVTPGTPLFHVGETVIVVAGSIDQGRLLAEAAQDVLPKGHLRWSGLEATTAHRIVGVHVATGTAIRVISSSGKRAMGLGAKNRLLLADEPASWEERSGGLMIQALQGALGKIEGSRLLIIGTRSPAAPDNWWPRMVRDGCQPGRYVKLMAAPDNAAWDDYLTLARANPVVRVSPSLRKRILRERDAARVDEVRRYEYGLWRLNRHGPAEDDMLLTVDEWERVMGRPVADRVGECAVGIDAGAGRSWSAAVAVWRSGRVEAWAVVGGVPSLEDRERADGVPLGLYRRLARSGRLHVLEGLETASPEVLVRIVRESGVRPGIVLGDRFQATRLRDACKGWAPFTERITRWSTSTEDIGLTREMVRDGGMSAEENSRGLLTLSLSQARVRFEGGNVRIVKRRGDASRDDVAVALSLAAGAIMRSRRRPAPAPLRSVIV